MVPSQRSWFALSPVIGDFGDPGDRTTWNFLYGFRVPSFTICGIDVASALKLNPPLNADAGNGCSCCCFLPYGHFRKELFNTACAENGPPSAKLVSVSSPLLTNARKLAFITITTAVLHFTAATIATTSRLILLLLLLPHDFGFVLLPQNRRRLNFLHFEKSLASTSRSPTPEY